MIEVCCSDGCCSMTGFKEYKKTALITLLREELLFDLREAGFLISDSMAVESEADRRHVADIGERIGLARVTRIMDITFAECVDACHPWTKREAPDGVRKHDVYEEKPCYKMYMTLPDDVSDTTLDYLEKLVHDYIIDQVMWDWLSIKKPTEAEAWAKRGEKTMEKLKSALAGRTGRVRRPLTPF